MRNLTGSCIKEVSLLFSIGKKIRAVGYSVKIMGSGSHTVFTQIPCQYLHGKKLCVNSALVSLVHIFILQLFYFHLLCFMLSQIIFKAYVTLMAASLGTLSFYLYMLVMDSGHYIDGWKADAN